MISEGLNVDAALLIHLEVHHVNEAAIAALFFVTALWDNDPFTVANLIVIGLLRHGSGLHGIELTCYPRPNKALAASCDRP
jgi:hypothetical protein